MTSDAPLAAVLHGRASVTAMPIPALNGDNVTERSVTTR